MLWNELKLGGFITLQQLAHYFEGVGSFGQLFLSSETAEWGRLIGPAGYIRKWQSTDTDGCDTHPQLGQPALWSAGGTAWSFQGGFKMQVNFFRHSAAGREQNSSDEEAGCNN